MDPFFGEIRLFGFDYPPQGWLPCNGQLLSIQQYSTLYALLGVTYGGNGSTNFALPNFNGRAPMSQGQGTGLSPRAIGESFGSEAVTLLTQQMPAHDHPLTASSQTTPAKRSATPANGSVITNAIKTSAFLKTDQPNTMLSPVAVSVQGGSQPHENRQPYLALNFCICIEGIFPDFDE